MDIKITFPSPLLGEVTRSIHEFVSAMQTSTKNGNIEMFVTLRTPEDKDRIIDALREIGTTEVTVVD